MDIQTFIQNFKEAFGENAELPLVFWYSDILEGTAEKINGCFFKGMKTVREGGTISLNAANSTQVLQKCLNAYRLLSH